MDLIFHFIVCISGPDLVGGKGKGGGLKRQGRFLVFVRYGGGFSWPLIRFVFVYFCFVLLFVSDC